MWLALTAQLPAPPARAGARVSIMNRVVAKLIDLALMIAVSVLLPYPLGPLLGFLYSLLGDGLNFGPFKGQSVGKKLMGLQVLNPLQHRPANFKDSLFRNMPVGVATFFAIIPIWGWLILGLIGIPLMAMEIYLMMTVEAGHRLGDVMGDTEVVDARR